ncbi:agamous-like MADS-box protein AGL62 [Vicia villosa]|uniref:agamous-like MADS-box protein AGL62 n=1 Tax=Vicia villosa TaxID=3911 RepID=UPI00273B295F|nr:agamous-like MADS-box protein AGL62 [Vicia villosa]
MREVFDLGAKVENFGYPVENRFVVLQETNAPLPVSIMSTEKKTCGRKKIEMKKMSKESNLQVTFSKRRSGVFKKASELCTLCGADVALVVFSPGEKVFSFGRPHVDTVIDRYLSRVPPQNNDTMQFIEAQRSANVRELNNQLTQINNTLDIEKIRGDELSHLRKVTEAQFWWACPIDGMNMAQIKLFKKGLSHHQGNLQQTQMFQPQFFQNPMLQSHLFGFNNMGGRGRYGPFEFF